MLSEISQSQKHKCCLISLTRGIKSSQTRGWPRGRVVKFARSAAGGPVFRRFESWVRTWHCSSDHAEAASHMPQLEEPDRKSTRLNSSHANISYAVFCLKKKKKENKLFI